MGETGAGATERSDEAAIRADDAHANHAAAPDDGCGCGCGCGCDSGASEGPVLLQVGMPRAR